MRVPRAIGDFLILDALAQERRNRLAVDDREIVEAMRLCGRLEGIFLCPEGAACIPALQSLVREQRIGSDEVVVLFNTGTGLKYLEIFD